MPTEIEETIYRLGLDGSAYIEGVDKAAASTKKLSEAQAEANKKLAELKVQQAEFIRQSKEMNAGITALKANTIELTKRINELKAAGKTNTAEFKALQTELRNTALKTKELSLANTVLKKDAAATATAIKVTTKEIAAMEAASGGFVKGTTKVITGLRTLANIIPGLGISGLILLIAGPLVNAITAWVDSMDLAAGKLDLVSDAIRGTDEESENLRRALRELGDNAEDIATGAFKNLDDAIKKLKDELGETPTAIEVAEGALVILGKKVDDLSKKYKDLRELQRLSSAGSGGLGNVALNQQLSSTQKAIDEANKKIREGEEKTAEFRVETARKSLLSQGEANRKFLEDNLQLSIDTNNQIAADQDKSLAERKQALKNNLSNTFQLNQIERNRDLQAARDDEEKRLLAEEKFRFANLKAQADYNEKIKNLKVKEVKEAANIYLKELQKLKSDIAKAELQGFTSEENIRKAIEADFKMREDAYKEAYSKHQLTADQLKSLQDYLNRLQKIALDTQLNTFREQKQAYLDQINDEITSLQFEESTKRIAAIQNNFERERQTILLETEKTISQLEEKRDKKIDEILKNATQKDFDSGVIAQKIQVIKDLYSKMLDDLQVIKNQKLQQLSFETFEALTEDAKRLLDAQNLQISEDSVARLKQQSDLLLTGKISYKQYQEALTKIAHDEEQKRFEEQKAFLEAEIKRRDEKLFGDESLTPAERQQLRDEIIRLRQQLADAEKGNITGGNKPPPTDESPLAKFQEYAVAIQSLTESIISFWQQTNEAEQQALERSIALQQTRVDAATRIAERGNAEYLKAEQDRLDQLNVARENAARKQLGIDAALQASQILVGITGAISKIATPGIGAAETIAEIAIIIGALATGYGLVKSLQGNQPQLYKGTKYLERDGQPSGRDTIPVMANEGEAVIPTDINKEYHPAVSAIYDRTIPADELNRFVTTYHKIKPIPQVNHELIKEAASIHIEHDGKMSVLLQEHTSLLKENNELQREILGKKIHVENHVDKNGVATMVTEYLEKKKRERKI